MNPRLVTFSIDRSYPLREPKGIGLTDTMRGMDVGDSISIGDLPKSSAYNAAQRLGIKITMRTSTKGRRIWRVK